MQVKITCPLGHVCEEIKNNELNRCAWYVEMAGRDAQGNEHNEWRCSQAWAPILQVEVASSNRGQTAAIESLRNETIKRQNIALSALGGHNANIKNIEHS